MTMTTVANQPARIVRGMSELRPLVGKELGVSLWLEIKQVDISAFARLTGDLFWIHTDAERAAQSPWGTTIAHGLYTLSLGPRFMEEIVRWEALGLMQNYGYDKVRFTAPVPVGSRVRARMSLESFEAKRDGSLLALNQQFECDAGDRPVCVARFLLRFVEPDAREGE
jgi:acyl dehydratase